MKFLSALTYAPFLLTGLASVANAHTYLRNLTMNGVKYTEGQCILPYVGDRIQPVLNPTSQDMMCRTQDKNLTASMTCPIKAGSTITVEWHWLEDFPNDVISFNHLGPCIAYMAPLESKGHGDVWFKIFEEGYDPATKKWCVDKIREKAAHGQWNITIPADIKPGDYMIRTEIIALHEAYRENGAQYYPNCIQARIQGSGSATPKGYAIPGIYNATDAGIMFDLKKPYTSYPIPGPPLYKSGSADTNQRVAYSSQAGTPTPTPTAVPYATQSKVYAATSSAVHRCAA
ncbi:hypothetical protein DL89DRAFT_265374 [Linderina pennispora]|uniref:AA9 family lytic polysaccharide monooxygenase n=1 Tax=Linderina pennispora TaxID=61395 RepID=A0A1Y1WI86_9FUNG|nr:uncharacterized protein DL89DRAFT_265374 [Linderina pennispora]ORX73237.1 hypothetical protein DL89DRAFT_265374 [Linderina pennispora]